MKNKRSLLLLISILIMVMAAGCGKKNGTPIIENNDQNGDNSVINIEDGINADIAGDTLQNPEGDPTVDINSGEDDPDGLNENPEEDDSGDAAPEDTQDMQPEETQDIVPEETADQDVSTDIFAGIGTVQTNSIYIANMSGKDITSLTLIFSEGESRGGEILNGETLKDGNLFVYTAADMNALQAATGLKLTVTALAKDDTVMSFPEVRVINPAGCTVVLTHGKSTSENQAGYEVYID